MHCMHCLYSVIYFSNQQVYNLFTFKYMFIVCTISLVKFEKKKKHKTTNVWLSITKFVYTSKN